MKSVRAKTIVAAWLRIPEISQNLVPCGKGETKITRYTDHKSLAQSPPSRFRALLGDPQAGKESRSQRRTRTAGSILGRPRLYLRLSLPRSAFRTTGLAVGQRNQCAHLSVATCSRSCSTSSYERSPKQL